MSLVLTCPASGVGLKLPTITSNLSLPSLHPLVTLPLDSLEKLFKVEALSNPLELHAILAGILLHCRCRFLSPLPNLNPQFYPIRLPDFLHIAQRITRLKAPWPTLTIDQSTNQLQLENWLSECQIVLTEHRDKQVKKELPDPDIEALIQYIWSTPAIKARKEWLVKALNQAPRLGYESALDTACNPSKFPARAIMKTKAYLLEFCAVHNQHDSLMLNGVLAAMDTAIINSATMAQLTGIRKDAPTFEELDALQLTTHVKNNSGIENLRHAMQAESAIEESYNLDSPQPRECDYKNKTAYQIALAGWEAKQRLKAKN